MTYVPPLGWVNGKLRSTQEWIDYFYDDDICQFIDSTVKPGQIRSAMLNEANADRKCSSREVVWNVAGKKAVSRILSK